MPKPSLAPIYIDYTYIFSAFIWLFSCIMHSEYIILACFKGVILYQLTILPHQSNFHALKYPTEKPNTTLHT